MRWLVVTIALIVVAVTLNLGLLAYATYDLTNLATIRDWPWQISVIDMAWGTTLNSIVAVAGFYAGRWLGL